MSLPGFVSELLQAIACSKLEISIINCRFLNSFGHPVIWNAEANSRDPVLVIQAPSPEEADRLWELQPVIQRIAKPYGWQKIEIKGGALQFEVLLQEKGLKNMLDSNLSTQERDILLAAIASSQSFAVVRLADNHVIQAGEGILKYSTVPAGRWPGYDITPLWVPHEVSWAEYQAGVVERSPDLDKIYGLLEYGPGNTGRHIRDIEYIAYRSRYENGKIVRGDRARFVADIWRLDNYFGEPCRLCMAKYSELV